MALISGSQYFHPGLILAGGLTLSLGFKELLLAYGLVGYHFFSNVRPDSQILVLKIYISVGHGL